jgi:hypothetical protein
MPNQTRIQNYCISKCALTPGRRHFVGYTPSAAPPDGRHQAPTLPRNLEIVILRAAEDPLLLFAGRNLRLKQRVTW